MKTIYLIRHAQSFENTRMTALRASISNLKEFRAPPSGALSLSLGLLNVPHLVDCPLSSVGLQEIENVGRQLHSLPLPGSSSSSSPAVGFLSAHGVQLVLHSPLRRARITCLGLVGVVAARGDGSNDVEYDKTCAGVAAVGGGEGQKKKKKKGDNSTGASPPPGVVETALLVEKSPYEWLPFNGHALVKRISDFEGLLAARPESDIAVVGHSQFFKKMLRLDYKFDNCDVIKCEFECNETGTGGKWKAFKKIFGIIKEEEEGKNKV